MKIKPEQQQQQQRQIAPVQEPEPLPQPKPQSEPQPEPQRDYVAQPFPQIIGQDEKIDDVQHGLQIPDYFFDQQDMVEVAAMQIQDYQPQRQPTLVWIFRNRITDYDQNLIETFKTFGWRVKTVTTSIEAEKFIAKNYVHCLIAGGHDQDWLNTYLLEFNIQRILWSLSVSRNANRLARARLSENLDVFDDEAQFINALKILSRALGGKSIAPVSNAVKVTIDPYGHTFGDIRTKLTSSWKNWHQAGKDVRSIDMHHNAVLDGALEAFQKDQSKRIRLWMGVSQIRLPYILEHGFSREDMKHLEFGRGLYLTTCSSKAYHYGVQDFGGYDTVLVLCDVALGRKCEVLSRHSNYRNAWARFDSVRVEPRSRLVNHNQYVVYDPTRVTIRFTVRLH